MTRLLSLSVAALPFAVLAFTTQPAEACVNGVYFDTHKATKLVAKAEKALRAGDFSTAMTLINESKADNRPRVRKRNSKAAARPSGSKLGRLAERAARVRAMVVVRTDGGIGWLGKHLRGKDNAKQRAGEVKKAVRTLAQHHKQRPKDPTVAAWYAEGLARGDAEARGEALKILQDLRKRELMPDPWSWAALAGLETDAKASKQAHERCRKIAPKKERKHCRHYLAGGTS